MGQIIACNQSSVDHIVKFLHGTGCLLCCAHYAHVTLTLREGLHYITSVGRVCHVNRNFQSESAALVKFCDCFAVFFYSEQGLYQQNSYDDLVLLA
jgi:hypothetical protein